MNNTTKIALAILFGAIIGSFTPKCRPDPGEVFVKNNQDKAWKIGYETKIKWLKPCKNEDSKAHNELILVCEKKKWVVSGVI